WEVHFVLSWRPIKIPDFTQLCAYFLIFFNVGFEFTAARRCTVFYMHVLNLLVQKKVDPFVSTVHLPHPFKTEVNKVAVFTENPDQAKVAQENGAAFVGGADLVQRILDDEVDADFYLAVPDMISKLLPLKNKLRKKFPKNKRGRSHCSNFLYSNSPLETPSKEQAEAQSQRNSLEERNVERGNINKNPYCNKLP
uniref:Mitochondrial ribosomal protein L1 n=1 Tax=Hucho hucho TaxID=62062 RepID=A0A4W5PW01_9TELE